MKKALLHFSLMIAFVFLSCSVLAQRRNPPPASSSRVSSRPTITNSIGMEFVEIPAGTFWMGSENGTPNCPSDDPFTTRNEYQDCIDRYNSQKYPEDQMPRHQVNISKKFYIGKYEVTQEQWYKVMGTNPAHFKTEEVGGDSRRHPVETVSWDDVQDFIRRLNSMEGTSVYRLPTEAEWEYAARAGSTGDYCFGNNAGLLGEYAWYTENSNNKTHPVGQKKPNAWGLYDVHGNVWEWCEDFYHDTYKGAPNDGSAWVTGGKYRILRGGSWGGLQGVARAVYRFNNYPGYRNDFIGFRVVGVVRPPSR